MFDKILFAKIGWAPNYEGEDCTGDFANRTKLIVGTVPVTIALAHFLVADQVALSSKPA